MSEEHNDDRRRSNRLERRDEIKVKEYTWPERGDYQQARIMDLSGGGLQIECLQFYPEKTLLKIEMNFTGWQRYTRSFLKHFGEASTQPLVVLAEVLRCKQIVPGARYEVGVRFKGIDENQRQALERFIRDQITTGHAP